MGGLRGGDVSGTGCCEEGLLVSAEPSNLCLSSMSERVEYMQDFLESVGQQIVSIRRAIYEMVQTL